MPNPTPTLLPSEPDPAILARMAQAENACLVMLVAVVATNLATWLFPSLAEMFPSGLQPMKAESVLAVLLSALSLLLSNVGQTKVDAAAGLFAGCGRRCDFLRNSPEIPIGLSRRN